MNFNYFKKLKIIIFSLNNIYLLQKLNELFKKMKAYTLLILFSFFQVLFCAIEGFNVTKLNDVYVKSLPYLKTFVNSSFPIPKNIRYNKVSLKLSPLEKNNTKFTIDNLDILHVKFVHLKAKMAGQFKYNRVLKTSPYYKFNASLTNISFEQQFSVNMTKGKNGKYTIKYKKVGQSEINFKVQKLNFTDYKDAKTKDLAVKAASGSIKNLNFKTLVSHLSKIQTVILQEFAKELKK